MRRWLFGFGCVAVLASAAASAHPKGFHKRLLLQTSPRGLTVLVTMDLDGGERTRLLRASMDSDGNGVLGKEEVARLKGRLSRLATAKLRLAVSGYPLALESKEAKVDLRGEPRATAVGVSVAVLLEAPYPERPSPAMELSVTDESPDDSHIHVVLSEEGGDGGRLLADREIVSGETVRLPLSLK